MSSQAVRNKVNNGVRRVITDVKRKIIAEGRKRITELKDKLMSPEYIIKMLTAEINSNSCSLEGREKFHETADKLTATLQDMLDIIVEGLKVFGGLEKQIGKISSKVELPEGTPNPIEGIKKITDALKPLTEILNYIIKAAPAILASQVSVPVAGGPVSGAVIANTNNGVNLAKVKIKEYVNLIRSLPRVLDRYIHMADLVYAKIAPITEKLKFIQGEIERLMAFIKFLQLDFENKCNYFNLNSYGDGTQVPSSTNTTYPPNTSEPPTTAHPTLEEITTQINELYGNMLEDLIARGDHKAIRRVYTLGAQFQRLTNTQVKVINIGSIQPSSPGASG